MPSLEMSVSSYSIEGRSFESDGNKEASHLTLVGTIVAGGLTANTTMTIFTESWSKETEAGNMVAKHVSGVASISAQKKVSRGLFNQFVSELTTAKIASCSITHDGDQIVWPTFIETAPSEETRTINSIVLRTGARLFS